MTPCTPRLARLLASLLLAVAACSGGPTLPPADAGGDTPVATDVVARDHTGGDGSTVCATDALCDDGLYCDGTERCAPGTSGADARGCVHGAAPCTTMQTCAEATHTCVALSCTHASMPDMDGDGHADIACGGDDCDDTDPHRFPGNPEVCLVGTTSSGALTRTGAATVMGAPTTLDPTHDEDCDPATYASATTHDGDHDMDTYVDRACSNTDRSGMANHGTDCADLNPVAAVPASLHSSVPPGSVHPMQPEGCNGVDDNCDDQVDEGDPGGGGSCADPLPNACAPTVQHCTMGALTCVPPPTGALGCCAGHTDCDGNAANGCEVDTGGDVRNCGACGHVCSALVGATAQCSAGVCSSTCPSSASSNCSGTCVDLTGGCSNGLPGFCANNGSWACAGTGRTCNAPPLPFTTPQVYTYSSPGIGHACGGLFFDGATGHSLAALPPNPASYPCFLSFGPYAALPTGNYRATFYLEGTQNLGPTPGMFTAFPWFAALHLDVTENSGAIALASDDTYKGSATATGWNWASVFGPVAHPVTFRVSETCAQNVEFRVEAFYGFQAGSYEYVQGVYSIHLDPG